MGTKAPIHAYISTKAGRDLEVFAADRGVSKTSLIEVFSRHLLTIEEAVPDLIRQARRWDADGRVRRGTGNGRRVTT